LTNFQFNEKKFSQLILENKSLKLTGDHHVFKTRNLPSSSKNLFKPKASISKTEMTKKLQKNSSHNFLCSLFSKKEKFIGINKKLSAGKLVPAPKRIIRNSNYYSSVHLNAFPEKVFQSRQKPDCKRDKGSFLGNSNFKKSSLLAPMSCDKKGILIQETKNPRIKNKRVNVRRKELTKKKKNLKSKPILKELVRQLKGNDLLQLEILKTLGCKIPIEKKNMKDSKRVKSKSKTKRKAKSKSKTKESISQKTPSKLFKLEKLKKLNDLILIDKIQVSKLKTEIKKNSLQFSKVKARKKSRSRNKKSRLKLNLQPSHLPPPNLLKDLKGPSTVHEKKSIGFVSDLFSLQNNQVFQCNKKRKLSNFKILSKRQTIDLTTLPLGSKAFNKKLKKNKKLTSSKKKKSIKTKENIPLKLRSAKKSRQQNYNLKSPLLVRIGSTASLKNQGIKSKKIGLSSGNKRVLRNYDIKHHMNIIYSNDLNLERRKPKKRKRILN
jgi:hypothetical protein